MELEVTWGRTVRVWWAYLWRNLIAIVVAILISGVVGCIIGFVMAMLGVDRSTTQVVATLFGAIIGLVISVVPMKMILGKGFGEFRLVLVAKA